MGKIYNINTMTLEDFREMIAETNDNRSSQLRCTEAGQVYMSQKVGADDIEGLRFRWETFDAGNGYAGPTAAADDKYIKESYEQLMDNWKSGRTGYIDY